MCTMKIVWFEILLICAIVKMSLTQELGGKQRSKRNTYAGYTQDNDTCKKYNENLKQMWNILSKHINSTETVSEQALHNIAIIIKAYIDHHNSHKEEEVELRPQIKRDEISEVLRIIKKVLGTNDATIKVYNIILDNFKPNYEEKGLDCRLINEDNLYFSINLLYKNYQENAHCRGDYETELLRGNIRRDPPLNAKHRRLRSSHVEDEEIINDSEWNKDFFKNKIPFDHNIQESLTARSSAAAEGSKSRKAYQSSYWPPKIANVRIDESCVNYANRKFLFSLRDVIDRFHDSRDCTHDDTSRIENNKIESNQGQHLLLQVADEACCNQGIKVLAATRAGQPEQSQINNYVDIVKEFKTQEDPNRSKTILVINGVSYNIPLLLKLKNKTETIDPLLLYNSFENGEHQETEENYNKVRNNADNDHKTFEDSSTRGRNNKFVFAKPLHIVDVLKVHNEVNIKNNKTRHDNIRNYLVHLAKQQNKDTPKPLSDISESKGNNNIINNYGPRDTIGVSFDTVGKILSDVRNSSLQNVQIDVNSKALKDKKGYVELSYLVKYPKSIIYRPQYLVKNILPYDDFIKVASHLYNTNDDQQLIKIVRFLPNERTQVLFETQDIKSPLEVYNMKEQTLKKSPIRTVLDPDDSEYDNYIHINEKKPTDYNYSGSLIEQTNNNEAGFGNISIAQKNSTLRNIPAEYTFTEDKTRSVGNIADLSQTSFLDSHVQNTINIKKSHTENKYFSNLNMTDSLAEDQVVSNFGQGHYSSYEDMNTYYNLRSYEDESNEKLKDILFSDINFKKSLRENNNDIEVEQDGFLPIFNVSSTTKQANADEKQMTDKNQINIGVDQTGNLSVDKYSISASQSNELPQNKLESQQVNAESLITKKENSLQKNTNESDFENIYSTRQDQIDGIQRVDELQDLRVGKQKMADENTEDNLLVNQSANSDSRFLRGHDIIPDINLTAFDTPEIGADQAIEKNIRMFVTPEEALLIMKEKLLLKDLTFTTKRSGLAFEQDYLRVIPANSLERPITQTEVKHIESTTKEINSTYMNQNNFPKENGFFNQSGLMHQDGVNPLDFGLKINDSSTRESYSLVEDKNKNNNNKSQQDKTVANVEQLKNALIEKLYIDRPNSNVTNEFILNGKLLDSNQNNKIDGDLDHSNRLRPSKVITDNSKRDSLQYEEFETSFNKTHYVQKHEAQNIPKTNVVFDLQYNLRAHTVFAGIDKPESFKESNIQASYEQGEIQEGGDIVIDLNNKKHLKKLKAHVDVEETNFFYMTPNIELDVHSPTGYTKQDKASDKYVLITMKNEMNNVNLSVLSQDNHVTKLVQLDMNAYNEDSHTNSDTENVTDYSTNKLISDADILDEVSARKYKMSLDFTEPNSLQNDEIITERGLREDIRKQINDNETNHSPTLMETVTNNKGNLQGVDKNFTRDMQGIVDRQKDLLPVHKSSNYKYGTVSQTEVTDVTKGEKPTFLVREVSQSVTPTASLQENPHNCSHEKSNKPKYLRKDENNRKIISSDEKSSDITYLKILPVPKSKENSNEKNIIHNRTLHGKPAIFEDNVNKIQDTVNGMSSTRLPGTNKNGDANIEINTNTNKGFENLENIKDSPAAASLREWWGTWKDKLESNFQSIETSVSKLHQELIASNSKKR